MEIVTLELCMICNVWGCDGGCKDEQIIGGPEVLPPLPQLQNS